MFKKGPTEKEKILKHLTEKEIKDQLYGFRAKEPQAAKEEFVIARPAIKKEAQKEVKKEAQKQGQWQKNPYIVVQIVLLAIFLILIWVSIRQMIKAVAKMHNRPVVTSGQFYKKPVNKKINKR